MAKAPREAPGPSDFTNPATSREFHRAVVWIGMVVAVALTWMLAQPLLLIMGGIVFAALLDGGVRLLGKAFPRVGRGLRLVVVASPNLSRPSGDLAVPVVVRGVSDLTPIWDVMAPGGSSRIAIDPVLRLSSLIMVRDAVRAGVGAARLPVSLVSHDLAAGKLVHWGDVDGPEITLWALYPSRRLLSARVSAFLDCLKEAFPSGAPEELAAFLD